MVKLVIPNRTKKCWVSIYFQNGRILWLIKKWGWYNNHLQNGGMILQALDFAIKNGGFVSGSRP